MIGEPKAKPMVSTKEAKREVQGEGDKQLVL